MEPTAKPQPISVAARVPGTRAFCDSAKLEAVKKHDILSAEALQLDIFPETVRKEAADRLMAAIEFECLWRELQWRTRRFLGAPALLGVALIASVVTHLGLSTPEDFNLNYTGIDIFLSIMSFAFIFGTMDIMSSPDRRRFNYKYSVSVFSLAFPILLAFNFLSWKQLHPKWEHVINFFVSCTMTLALLLVIWAILLTSLYGKPRLSKDIEKLLIADFCALYSELATDSTPGQVTDKVFLEPILIGIYSR